MSTSDPHTLTHSALWQVAELDDKLGSEWNFLPLPPNMRFGKETSSRSCVFGEDSTRFAFAVEIYSI